MPAGSPADMAQHRRDLEDAREQARQAELARIERERPQLVAAARAQARQEEQDRRQQEEKQAQERRLNYPRPEWLPTKGRHVGVVGASGVGKSTFLNIVRGLEENDVGGAETGETETTMEPTEYEHPALKVSFWDLPGAGTLRFPLETYVQKMGLKYFEAVLILKAGYVTETDIMLLEDLRRQPQHIPHFYVHNKVDEDVDSGLRKGKTSNAVLEALRQDMASRTGVSSDRIYVISSYEENRHHFDFQKLERDLMQALRP
mmetsp:Transcript_68513/g.127819  ORF Transcript_68513/g.127819 Transcript_68513/m.127819 type:complete len:260 (+) Transcript_68513:94-873(+)